MNRRHHQQGIALITTLIMLSVVTLMAVAFLAVSRRERAAVSTSSDRLDARAMAEAALQRAEAEIVARVLATSNLLSYDLLVSTNYINPLGFVRNDTNIANVAFHYPNGQPVTGADLLQVYRNLQIDPRVPVFVITNNVTGEQEFRYYLDFNRNWLVETNGLQVEIDNAGRAIGTGFHVGDPEWIGVLQRPDLPHSGSNHFVGRYLYMVLPLGKMLDLNFIHNQAKRIQPDVDGFVRNQGVGPWEINLAAFLHDLNTNAWVSYLYRTNLAQVSAGTSFDAAVSLLRQRYRLSPVDNNPTYANLPSFDQVFGAGAGNVIAADGIDQYGDGPLQLGIGRPWAGGGNVTNILDNDNPAAPWPGGDNPTAYFDPQELFTIPELNLPVAARFTNRLFSVSTNRSTYDRHTVYRLLGQLGTDSVPNYRGKIHLNYDNRLDFDTNLIQAGHAPGTAPLFAYHATNFVAWRPAAFFTNAADRILKALHPTQGQNGAPVIGVTNIAIWPTNYYSPAVHRSLQLAANIYDAITNRPLTGYPHIPTVFRPVFASRNGEVVISDFIELTDNWDVDLWDAPMVDRDFITNPGQVAPLDRIAGIPVVIGAKKGYPNFNEFELQTVVVAGRKLELVKRSPTSRPAFTNQLYTIAISNVFGVEFWNSYENPFPRQLELRARLQSILVLTNQAGNVIPPQTNLFEFTETIDPDEWQGQEFRIPIRTNVIVVPTSAYFPGNGALIPIRGDTQGLDLFDKTPGFPIPILGLNVTNRLQVALIDTSVPGGRLVEYVDLDNLNSNIDITRELFGEQDELGQTSQVGSFWKTNRVLGIPEGIRNQIQVSMGAIDVGNWNSVSGEPLQGQDKEKAIERFRQFVGLATPPSPVSPVLRMQAPFSPGLKLLHLETWQVNDPLVNDLIWDLVDVHRTNQIQRLPPLFDPPPDWSNLGEINDRYLPWGRVGESSAPNARAKVFNLAIKDPQIWRSDDWDFPTNQFPTLGWLGRVHRGTPWQTIYLKSEAVSDQDWLEWTGHPQWLWPNNTIPLGTHPTNDWRILEVFTVALNDNMTRGQLAVNQSGLAAWSAVLSGVPVFTNEFGFPSTNYFPHIIEPNTPQLRALVDGINNARSQRFGQRFSYLGEILSTPELTVASPYLAISGAQTPADAVVERIPQMILSLLRRDEPRFVVFAYGQSLSPAPGSVVTDFGPFFQMPTNYIITGEYVTKTLMRLETVVEPHPVSGELRQWIKTIKETYNEVPPTE